MEKTRIFITGMGAVTPVGIGVPAYWQGINEGKCGIVEKESIGSFTQPGLRMALVDGFDPKAYLSTKRLWMTSQLTTTAFSFLRI